MAGLEQIWATPDMTGMTTQLTNNATAVATLGTRATADEAATTALTARVAALEALTPMSLSGTTGTGTLGANIGVAATFDLTVPLALTMPNANYGAYFSIEGPAGLLGVFVGQVKSKTTTTVVVSLKNTGLVSIGSGAIVRVVAIN